MESLVAALRDPWIVSRVPLAIGPIHRSPTLANFLYYKIVHGERFELWARSTRYPIDADDLVRIVTRLIADPAMSRRAINIALRAFRVIDFVHALERITDRTARYTVLDKGAHYELRCPEVDTLAREMGLDRSEGYLERVPRKYFVHP
jgi:nucleoside-diphosphate-sugar epimerase